MTEKPDLAEAERLRALYGTKGVENLQKGLRTAIKESLAPPPRKKRPSSPQD